MLLFGSIAITIRPKQPANNRIYRKMDYQFSNDRFYQELRRQSRLASDYGELEGLLVLSHFNADDISQTGNTAKYTLSMALPW